MLLRIERDDPHLRVAVVFGNEPALCAEGVVRVRDGEVDLLDSHLEHVARVGAGDIDRAGEDVPARPFVRDLSVDVAQRLLDVRRRDARAFESRGRRRDQRPDDDAVARVNTQHRLGGRVVITPCHGRWSRHDAMRCRSGGLLRAGRAGAE